MIIKTNNNHLKIVISSNLFKKITSNNHYLNLLELITFLIQAQIII